MAYNDLLKEVDGNPFLWRMFILLFFNSIPNALIPTSLVLVFLAPKEFRCSLPDEVEDFLKYNQSSVNSSLEYFIPYDSDEQEYSKCMKYQRGNGEIEMFFNNYSDHGTGNDSTPSVISCGGNYNFGDLRPDLSASMEFNYLCENSWLKPLIMIFYFIGKFFTVLAGYLSDKYGRRPVFIILTFAIFVMLFIQSFVDSTWAMIATTLFNGFCATATFMVAFVLGCECTIPEHRNFISISGFVGYALGYSVAGLIAYLTPNWRWLLRANAITGIVYITNIWLIPESPHWLMAKGRTEQAKEVFAYIAKCNNGPQLSKKFVQEVEEEAKFLNQESMEKNDENKRQSFRNMFTDFLRKPRLLLIIAVLCYSWFTVSLIYYGIFLNVESLAGNVYLNNALMGFVEIPGLVMAYLAVKHFSRPISHGATAILSAVFCLAATLLDEVSPVASTVAGFMGKTLISGLFYFIYIHTTEIVPTIVRNSYLCATSLVGRIGSLISPYFAYIGYLYGSFVLFLGMSILTVTSGTLTLLLTPETNNVELPETTRDVLKMKTLCSRRKKRPLKKPDVVEEEKLELKML